MSDKYTNFANSTLGKNIVNSVGLPSPTILDRYRNGDPVIKGDVLLGAAPNASLLLSITSSLRDLKQSKIFAQQESRNLHEISNACASNAVKWLSWTPKPEEGKPFKALVFDASGIKSSDELVNLYYFFQPAMRKLKSSARIIVVGRIPEHCQNAKARAAQRALLGFVKAAAKEVGKGGTAQLIYVEEGAEDALDSSIKFFLSPKSAYVSGQVVRVYKSKSSAEELDWDQPLKGKRALVTGAARGIGAAIARTLARDGAKVICLDIPQAAEALNKVASEIGGDTIELDITNQHAPQQLVEDLSVSGLDIIVHNAGITRDKTLGKMKENLWKLVVDVNLSSEERINDALFENKVFNKDARIICVSSVSGIAGNFGQTNYAASKAGVIGMVDAMAEKCLEQGITINAVAPGFIETEMTAAIPLMIREGGRRLNAMSQGGEPVDVAEAIAYFAQPASKGVNGNIVRVCGLALIGA